jgi:hypothetical protein
MTAWAHHCPLVGYGFALNENFLDRLLAYVAMSRKGLSDPLVFHDDNNLLGKDEW